MKKAKEMTDEEIILAVNQHDSRGKVAAIFSKWSGRIDRAVQQKPPITLIELRRMELQAAEEVIATLNLKGWLK